MSPIKFLDDLVKGLVLGGYDFFRLTVAAFLIPFVSGTSRFWPAVFSILGRLSSFTYIALWVVITVSVTFGRVQNIASEILGLKAKSDVTVLQTIVGALIISIIIDLSIRAGFYRVTPRSRKQRYEAVARLAVGNIGLGVCTIVLAFPYLGSLVQPVPLGSLGLWFVPSPTVSLFACSLALLTIKAYAISSFATRIAVGLLVIVIVPFFLINVSLTALLFIGGHPLFQSKLALKELFTECTFTPTHIQISGYLQLENGTSLPIKVRQLAVEYEDGEKTFTGKIIGNQRDIVVSNDRYTRFDLTADYDPADSGKNPDPFCSLVLIESLDPIGDHRVREPAPRIFNPSK